MKNKLFKIYETLFDLLFGHTNETPITKLNKEFHGISVVARYSLIESLLTNCFIIITINIIIIIAITIAITIII